MSCAIFPKSGWSFLIRHMASSSLHPLGLELHASFVKNNNSISQSSLSSVQFRLRFRQSCLSCACSLKSMTSSLFMEVVHVSFFGQNAFPFHVGILHTLQISIPFTFRQRKRLNVPPGFPQAYVCLRLRSTEWVCNYFALPRKEKPSQPSNVFSVVDFRRIHSDREIVKVHVETAILEGKLIGVCSLLTSTTDLGSQPVGGDCSASRPKHNPPCRVAVDGHIEGYNNEEEVGEPSASAGKRRREVQRQLWVKQGAVKHGWDEMTFQDSQELTIQQFCPECRLQNLSHVHTRKTACVARERCARCGVLFTHTVACKGSATACQRNPIEKITVVPLNAKEHKIFVPCLPLLWRPPSWRGGRRLRPNSSSPTCPLPVQPCTFFNTAFWETFHLFL